MRFNDIEVLKGITKGDEKVLKLFYKRNFKSIRKHILASSGTDEDAEDVFQDSLIIVYQKLKSETFTLDCPVHIYFYSVCKNVWRNRLRKNDKRVIHEDIVTISNYIPSDMSDDIERMDRERIYRKGFLRLDDKCRNLLSLFSDGKNTRQIAAVLGYSEAYVRKKKFACKECLIRIIQEDPMYKELILDSMDV